MITAALALLGRIPLAAWVVAGAVLLAGVWHWSEVREAVRASYEVLARQFGASEKAADGAEIDVLKCPPGKWNRETHRCVP